MSSTILDFSPPNAENANAKRQKRRFKDTKPPTTGIVRPRREKRMTQSNLKIAIRAIEFARNYTHSLMDDFSEDEWYQQPAAGCTNLGYG